MLINSCVLVRVEIIHKSKFSTSSEVPQNPNDLASTRSQALPP